MNIVTRGFGINQSILTRGFSDIIIDIIIKPVRVFFRKIVKKIFNDTTIEHTFTYGNVLIPFVIEKTNTRIIAKKRILTFYEARPARRER